MKNLDESQGDSPGTPSGEKLRSNNSDPGYLKKHYIIAAIGEPQ
jgi:hypothetical protein